MCDEIRVPNRSRAAHPGPDPDETYAMTVYVSDTIDAGIDDQEVRFAPSPRPRPPRRGVETVE